MGTIEQGAEQAVRNCARVQPGEKVVIITDLATEHIAEALGDVAEGIAPETITTFVLRISGTAQRMEASRLGCPRRSPMRCEGPTSASLRPQARKAR